MASKTDTKEEQNRLKRSKEGHKNMTEKAVKSIKKVIKKGKK